MYFGFRNRHTEFVLVQSHREVTLRVQAVGRKCPLRSDRLFFSERIPIHASGNTSPWLYSLVFMIEILILNTRKRGCSQSLVELRGVIDNIDLTIFFFENFYVTITVYICNYTVMLWYCSQFTHSRTSYTIICIYIYRYNFIVFVIKMKDPYRVSNFSMPLLWPDL